ncbi:TadE/TadG family type IV pilus assembly protein [Flavisphingomonas formosensis]|uniref:TadE/TadG family type IV pilus assembly protein n=1 Tax=Flavisphingomonas formosensis TaxID=861534 RepID=UPI0012F98737|nr:TadE/TadG family type IV pilus assembly protein [Sphingomonas formosensis]
MQAVIERLRRLRRDQSGLALIEFAITAPVLLTLGLMGIEVVHFAIANLRCSQIAMTVADNASRVRQQITEDDINEVMQGAILVGNGIDFGNKGRVILSDLEPTSTYSTDGGKQWIRWQRCVGVKNVTSSYGVPKTSTGTIITNGTEKTAPSSQATSIPTNGTTSTPTAMGPSGRQIAALSGTAVMFVEVVYDYQPLVPLATPLLGTRTLNYVAAFNVRQRTDQTLYAGSGSVKSCNSFTSS